MNFEHVMQPMSNRPICNWLNTLPAWDGVERLEHWMHDFMSVADTPYTRLVSRFYLVAMVARAMEPGCKFDYCLVLEGNQGLRKSSALAVLGGEWFSDADLQLDSKDAMRGLQGIWLHEVSYFELGRLTVSGMKDFLFRGEDKYRQAYGRTDVSAPRMTVFATTTNDGNRNKAPFAARHFSRHFWPIECTEKINTSGLRATRNQLFAEALAAYRRGDRYWPSREEQISIFDPQQREANHAD